MNGEGLISAVWNVSPLPASICNRYLQEGLTTDPRSPTNERESNPTPEFPHCHGLISAYPCSILRWHVSLHRKSAIIGNEFASFSTSTHRSVTLKGDSFCWNCFGGVVSAANQILSLFGNSCSEPQQDNPIVQHSYPQPQCLLSPLTPASIPLWVIICCCWHVLGSHGYVCLPFWQLILLICLGSSFTGIWGPSSIPSSN